MRSGARGEGGGGGVRCIIEEAGNKVYVRCGSDWSDYYCNGGIRCMLDVVRWVLGV